MVIFRLLLLLQKLAGEILALTQRIVGLSTYHECYAFLPDYHHIVSSTEILSLAPELNKDHLKVIRMPGCILEELTLEVFYMMTIPVIIPVTWYAYSNCSLAGVGGPDFNPFS